MFPLGVLVDAGAVLIGGLVGSFIGPRMNENFKTELSSIFGVCAMAMGIGPIVLMKNMPPVIFSVVVGLSIGLLFHLGEKINTLGASMQKLTMRGKSGDSDGENLAMLVTVIVLFCASGTGIYGAIDAGMTGNHDVLITKAVLDFLTSMIFACKLGSSVAMISIPQGIVLLLLYLGGGFIGPLVSEPMICDFKACGGILMIATAFRMLNLKMLPTADMLLAMVLVMPCSWLWMQIK